VNERGGRCEWTEGDTRKEKDTERKKQFKYKKEGLTRTQYDSDADAAAFSGDEL